MSILEGLADNRQIYRRLFGGSDSGEASGEDIRLPETDGGNWDMEIYEPAPSVSLTQISASSAPAGAPASESLPGISGREPSDSPDAAAEYLLRRLEQEGRFTSQDLQGEEL